jgi:hypothetical protein
LPNRERAYVEASKARYYFEPREADDKSRLVTEVLGFKAPEELAEAVVLHAKTYPAYEDRRDRHGVVYYVEGPFSGPSGRRVESFRTVWIIESPSAAPRSVAIRPLPRRKS